MANTKLYNAGLRTRRAVLGRKYVDPNIKAAQQDPIAKMLQDMVTEYCWGYAWTRPKLNRKTRSMLTLAILTTLDKPEEIKVHTRGALTNGLTREEIAEVLLHATIYAGVPCGVNAFRNMRAAFAEIDAENAGKVTAKPKAKRATMTASKAKRPAAKRAAAATSKTTKTAAKTTARKTVKKTAG